MNMHVASTESPTQGLAVAGELAKRLLAQLAAVLSLAIVCLALWVVYHTLQAIDLAEVWARFRALPPGSLMLALLMTAIAYLVVCGYDVLALHHIERPLPYRRVALAGFLACAFGTNLGFAVVTGGAIRYRIYTLAGLSALEIAGVTAMSAVTATLGLGFILSLSLLFGTGEAAEQALDVPEALRRTIGWIMMSFMIAYLCIAAFRPLAISTPTWSLKLPSAKTAAGQIVLGAIDLMLLGTIIYVLIPDSFRVDFFVFLGVFALAFIAGVLSHVPGGIGVFESVMLLGLPEIPPAALLGAILSFRFVYYLVPLGLAAVALATHEALHQRVRIERARELAVDWWEEIGPQVMAAVVIFAGVVLLFSGSVPAPADRLMALRDRVPLPVVELAHLMAGAVGLALVLVARGLSLRLEAAYRYAVVVLAIGIASLLFKGLIYEGAAVLVFILIALAAMRPEFRRDGSLFDQGYPMEWVSTLVSIVALTVWLSLFSYKTFAYTHELWWRFGFDAELPRSLRTTAGVLGLAAIVALVKRLRPEPISALPRSAALHDVRRIVRADRGARAGLALLGDKRFLLSEAENAFIMYRVKGKSWVAFGDPVGAPEEHERLVWAFRDLCDRHGGWPVYYLVDAERLPLYVELGLSLQKLGDEARVPLAGFSLEGPGRAALREIGERLRVQGLALEIVGSRGVPALTPELKRVSDDWLSHKERPEKGFSRGYFDPAYVAHFPCAVVRRGGRIIAFAILWVGAGKEELALDLIRYQRDAPEGILEFMVMEIMEGGKARGYRWFNLGMTPVVGPGRQALAPLWQRIGRVMYRQSEHFEDREGLRRFAEALGPVWRPKFLASPGGLRTPRILRDIASLVDRPRA
jgi:phosphatidylglycerol lysyltransferase